MNTRLLAQESITAGDLFRYINMNDKSEVAKTLLSKGFYKVDDGNTLRQKYRKDNYGLDYITEYGGECLIFSDNIFNHTKTVEYTSHAHMNTAAYNFNYGFINKGFKTLTTGWNGKNNRFHSMLGYANSYLVNIKWEDVTTTRGYSIDLPFIMLFKDETGSIDINALTSKKLTSTHSSVVKDDCSSLISSIEDIYDNARKGYLAHSIEELHDYARKSIRHASEALNHLDNCSCVDARGRMEEGERYAKRAYYENDLSEAQYYLYKAKNYFDDALREAKNCSSN